MYTPSHNRLWFSILLQHKADATMEKADTSTLNFMFLPGTTWFKNILYVHWGKYVSIEI